VNFVLKRWVPLPAITLLIILAGNAPPGAQNQPSQAHIRIVVIKTRDIPFYAPAIQGLIEGLKSKGYRVRERLDLKIVALSGKPETDRALVEQQVASKPDLLVTLGTDATRLASDQKPTIPILFSMVLDPVRLGVVKSLESPGGNFTGVTLPVSPGKQMDALLQTAPRVRRIGLLYTDQDPTSLAFIAEAREDAARLNVEIVALPVKAAQTTRDALQRFSPLPDALWLLPDPASSGAQALKETLEYARAHRLPVLGTSSGTVRAGALLALSANLEDQGSSVADMAARILDGTETPVQMRVRGPRRTVLALNLVTSQRLGITIPKEILHLADEVVEAEQEDK
jgi:putative ABC transport system substrate-binding protein